jgi:succinate dehydrogenase/fumarate reductase-like Fe-S protein
VNQRGLCGTCSTVVHDAEALACPRTYCDARNVVTRKPREIRPPEKNPGEVIDYVDPYDKWTL